MKKQDQVKDILNQIAYQSKRLNKELEISEDLRKNDDVERFTNNIKKLKNQLKVLINE
jgi:coenzyme F420-reducing hydrogenase delta subunit